MLFFLNNEIRDWVRWDSLNMAINISLDESMLLQDCFVFIFQVNHVKSIQ